MQTVTNLSSDEFAHAHVQYYYDYALVLHYSTLRAPSFVNGELSNVVIG